MPRFRNRATGRVVDVPDRPPGGDRPEVVRWERMLEAMDASRRWERLGDTSHDAPPPGPEVSRDMESWTREQLRGEARRRGLAVGGTRAELIERLRA